MVVAGADGGDGIGAGAGTVGAGEVMGWLGLPLWM